MNIQAILKSIAISEGKVKLTLEMGNIDGESLVALKRQTGKAVSVSDMPAEPLPLEKEIARQNCSPLVPMQDRPAFAKEPAPTPEPPKPKPLRKGGKMVLKPHPDNTPVAPEPEPTSGGEGGEWPEGDDSPGLQGEGEGETGEAVEPLDNRSILARAAGALL